MEIYSASFSPVYEKLEIPESFADDSLRIHSMSTLIIIKTAGHIPQIEEPQDFLTALIATTKRP